MLIDRFDTCVLPSLPPCALHIAIAQASAACVPAQRVCVCFWGWGGRGGRCVSSGRVRASGRTQRRHIPPKGSLISAGVALEDGMVRDVHILCTAVSIQILCHRGLVFIEQLSYICWVFPCTFVSEPQPCCMLFG